MAISSPRDDNRVPMLVATSNVDGATVVSVMANPTNHRLKALDGTTGSSFSSTNAQRDANRVPALWAVSSADGITPIPVYADSSGRLLTKST